MHKIFKKSELRYNTVSINSWHLLLWVIVLFKCGIQLIAI